MMEFPVAVMIAELLSPRRSFLAATETFPKLDSVTKLPFLAERIRARFANPSRVSLARLNFKKGAVFFCGKHVKEAVRPLPHIPDALLQIHENWLASQFLPPFVEYDSLNLSCARNAAFAQSADE